MHEEVWSSFLTVLRAKREEVRNTLRVQALTMFRFSVLC